MNVIDSKYTYKPLTKKEVSFKLFRYRKSDRSDNILADVYHSLRETDTINVYIPISDCFYAKSAVDWNLGIDLSVYDMENLLLSEGMLSYKSYGIPEWYARKWLVKGEQISTKSSRSIIYAQAARDREQNI